MYRQGQILRCKDFEFSDGSTADKLFVVLNTSTPTHPCLVLITTSNPRYYAYAHPGCNNLKRAFCITVDCDQDFNVDTYIKLPLITALDIEDFLSKKQLSFVGHISDICFDNLKKCLRKFKNDIPLQYWAEIYQAA
jgi:hypothetical protein